jgi:hypothetical protein
MGTIVLIVTGILIFIALLCPILELFYTSRVAKKCKKK